MVETIGSAKPLREMPAVSLDETDEQNIKLMMAGAFIINYNLGRFGWDSLNKIGDLIESATDISEAIKNFDYEQWASGFIAPWAAYRMVKGQKVGALGEVGDRITNAIGRSL